MVRNAAEEVGEHPTELVRYAADEAARDADDAVALLAAAGLVPTPGQPLGVPPGVLLDLGAVVRLRRWEAAGHAVHRDAGLPSAGSALSRVIDTLVDAAIDPNALAGAGVLARAVFDVAVTRFAWCARPILGADVALDCDDEDVLVEALARFLWANRHLAPATEKRAEPC